MLARLLARVEPTPRRRDVRVAVLLDAVLRRPFLTLSSAARILQTSEPRAQLALDAAAACTVDGEPLVSRHGDAWHLTPSLARDAAAGRYGQLPSSAELLWFRGGSTDTVRAVALAWLDEHTQVTSGDVAVLAGTYQSSASRILSIAAAESGPLKRGQGRGRNAHFVAAD